MEHAHFLDRGDHAEEESPALRVVHVHVGHAWEMMASLVH